MRLQYCSVNIAPLFVHAKSTAGPSRAPFISSKRKMQSFVVRTNEVTLKERF
jgi:hypothetical protein